MFKQKTKQIMAWVVVITLNAGLAYGAAEYVTVVKVLDNDDKGIIERQNGERWLIEKGVGALSFWRFEGRQVLIYSPGIFCGVGSKVILPDMGQEARIWNAELIEGGSSSGLKTPSSDPEITAKALAYLGYFNPRSKEKDKSDIVLALTTFQKENNLPQTGKISPDVQLALSKAVSEKKPSNEKSISLAYALLSSAKNLMHGQTSTSVGIETFITQVSSNGAIVGMADGSIYQIDLIDQIKTMLWLPTQRVLVQGDGLLHLGKGQKVRATRVR